MKSAKCPKCNSREIYKHTSVTARSNIAISFAKQAKLETYICAQCGYLEEYAANKDDLEKIKKKWDRVGY